MVGLNGWGHQKAVIGHINKVVVLTLGFSDKKLKWEIETLMWLGKLCLAQSLIHFWPELIIHPACWWQYARWLYFPYVRQKRGFVEKSGDSNGLTTVQRVLLYARQGTEKEREKNKFLDQRCIMCTSRIVNYEMMSNPPVYLFQGCSHGGRRWAGPPGRNFKRAALWIISSIPPGTLLAKAIQYPRYF